MSFGFRSEVRDAGNSRGFGVLLLALFGHWWLLDCCGLFKVGGFNEKVYLSFGVILL